MKHRTYGFSKRLTAMLLSVVMVFSMLPVMNITAAVVQENSKEADNSTMDKWTSFFSSDINEIGTQHAGGVWTDKSVLTADGSFDSAAIKLDGDNNFLVALSAMGSNSVVVGSTYAPTDTMFVLDVSNSMSDNALSNMVTATNNAIRTLLASEGNRVGVVLYGTNANVLLELDSYTGVTVGGVETFIELSGGNIRAARVSTWVPDSTEGGSSGGSGNWWEDLWGSIIGGGNSGGNGEYQTTYLKNSSGNDVTTSVSTGGGTYTQGGIWKAWQEFEAATVDTTSAIKRSPVMVLMCDGAATYSAADFDNVPNNPSHGTGSASGTGDGFVTQLTAAWVKAKMAEKYGTNAFLYTLGLDVEDISIAQAILDPANKTAATDIDDAWTAFLQGSATVSMYRRSQGGSNQNVTITNDTATTLAAAMDSSSYKYADKYFSATQISDLNEQFQNIVNEISLSAGYYPTHLDDNGSNYSGYITFVDEIGKGMEVKEVEGIVIGENTYTGMIFAKALVSGVFGTRQEPTAMGDEFVRSVKARLGLTDNNEVWALLNYAYNVRKSLHYTNDSDWSNYIVWYGDAKGNYLGYDEELESTATYRNACYAMLGKPDGTHQTTDMMYVGIQVSTNLSTGEQTVTFRVPASMLPVVTYQINIDGTKVEPGTTATMTYHGADPIQLVYEVGMKEGITELNVAQYATEVDGKYYLYTNKWNASPNLSSTGKNNLSYAYFEPGADNEHYYFTENAVILDAAGNPVTSTADLDTAGDYYYRHYIFKAAAGAAMTDGKVSAVADFHTEKLSADAIAAANNHKTYNSDNQRCVPKGTMHYDDNHHSALKGSNKTQSFSYTRYQIVDATIQGQSSGSTGAKHYELVYLGNNGRLQVNPATGISITKQVDDTITDVNATYTFDIEFDTVAVPNGTYNGVAVTDNKATVTVKAGETVYIYDLPVGATYEITERYGDGYKNSVATGDTDVVENAQIKKAVFTNTKRGTGSLTVEKDVTGHPFTTAQIETIDFNFVVELTKEDGTPYSGNVSVIKSGDSTATSLTFTAGKASFTLHDNQELTITNLPEGAKYTVYEVDGSGNAVAIGGTPRAGYELVSVAGGTAGNTAQGEIAEGEVDYAHFVNRYVATAISPAIAVDITKTVVGNGAAAEQFTFSIERITPATTWSQIIETGTGTANAVKTLNGLTFNGVGTYSFLIHELTPDESDKTPGMTYDAKRASFSIVVTDNGMDGQLEWSITNVVNATKSDDHTVAVAFNNIYELNSVTATFHAKKVLENKTGIDIPLTGFQFGLYSDAACTTLAFDGTDPSNPRSTFTAGPAGLVDIKVHINQAMITGGTLTYYLKEIVPAATMVGMSYDTTVYKVSIPVTTVGGQLQVGQIVVEPISGTSTADGTTAVFNNKYEVLPANVTLSGNKELNGRDWQNSDSFTFELYKTDATFHAGASTLATQTVNSSNKSFAFTLEPFTQVGIYHYLVKETNGGQTIDGITYDATEYHVTVTVTLQEGTNQLVAAVTVLKVGNGMVDSDQLNFVNTYRVAPTTVTLDGTKVIANNTPNNGGNLAVISPMGYQFELRENNNQGAVIETVTSDKDGKFAFQPLTFTAPGEYVYEIMEKGAGDPNPVNGVLYNAANRRVKITVTDNFDGTLSTAVQTLTGDPDSKFTNTYTAAGTVLGLTGYKELVGAQGTNRPLAENEFEFVLMPVDGAPMPDTAVGGEVTVANGADGKITFPDIPFSAVGHYEYTITEKEGTDGTEGIYYDKEVYTVTVDVTDNGAGKLVAQVTKIVADKGLADETTKHVIDFYNSYYAVPAEVILSGNKVLENVTAGMAAGTQIPLTGGNVTKFPFRFEIKAVTAGAPLPSETVVQSGENGAITFGGIIFDAVGEYKYTVEELIPVSGVSGVTYTKQTHNITVVVKDDQKGQLVAEVKLGDTAKSFGADGKTVELLSFKNTYEAAKTDDVILGGNKEFMNITPGIAAGTSIALNGGEFTFKLAAVTAGAPMPAGSGHVASNEAGGAFRFGALNFSKLGEYKYTISEVSDPVKGYITYADPVTVTVKVTDSDLDGKLETSVTYGSASSLQVVNKYTAAETKLALAGTKDMDTRDPRENEFKFMLTAVSGAPMPGTEDTVYVKNDAAGKILFPEITYDTVGEYKYTIKEVTAPDGYMGVTYDKAVYDVTVTVSDGGNGKLIAVAKSVKQGQTAEGDVVFFNKYQAAPVSVSFEGVKNLTGRELVDGEFTFVLKDSEGQILQTVKNKDGKIVFEDEKILTAGTHKFYIQEDTSAKAEGITYDTKIHEVIIEVKDDGYGQLKAYNGQTEVDSVGFSFTNVFTPADVKAEISVQKELQNLCGKPMGLDGFRFQLEDAAGEKTVQTSDAEGKAKFQLSFGAADAGKSFVYKLTEVNTEVKGMSYSAAVYEVKVTVTKDEVSGKLTATVAVTKDGAAVSGDISFVNVYNLEEPPKMGDDTDLTGLGMCMGISAVGLLAVLVLGRKKKESENA